jgi:Protein of unknown function (DUF1288).
MVGGEQRNAKALTQQLRELAQLRLRKILMLWAINPGLVESRDFLDKLTVEEEALVKSMAPLIREFLNSVVGLQ